MFFRFQQNSLYDGESMKQTIQSQRAPAAVGPYSPALKVDNLLFISGQIPLTADNQLIEDDFDAEVRQVLNNITALLAESGLDWSHVVKVGIFTTELHRFDQMNRIYEEFVEKPYPARAAVEVRALPKGVRIEMEAIAHVK